LDLGMPSGIGGGKPVGIGKFNHFQSTPNVVW
jgi:hypothetical protein